MNDVSFKKGIPMKSGALIKTFSLIALICVGFCRLYYIIESFTYSYVFYYVDILKYIINRIFGLTNFIFYLLTVIYFFGCYKKAKKPALIPVAGIIYLSASILSFLYEYICNSMYFEISDSRYICNLVLSYVLIILFIVSAFLRFKHKVWKIFASIFCVYSILLVAKDVYSIIDLRLRFMDYDPIYFSSVSYWVSFIFMMLSSIGTILFYVSVLLFVVRNTIPAKSDLPVCENVTSTQIDVERELRIISSKYEAGLISQEEYAKQREIILSSI